MNSAEIQFSAVIPTYNRGHLIGRAIESVLRQEKRPFELIVVDDGSEDDTRAQVAAFGDAVQYVYQPNAGSAVARNNGMRRAQGDWIALLDSDDVWQPGHLQHMAAAIAATNGAAHFYFADTIEPPEKGNGRRWETCNFTIDGAHQLNPQAADWVLLPLQPMMLQSTVFQRQAYLDTGGFLPQLRYRDDTHLFLKLGLTGPVCAVSGCGTRMTADDDPDNRLTLTYNQQVRGAKMQVIMFRDLLATVPALAPAQRRELERRLAHAYLAMARHAWRRRKGTAVVQNMWRCWRTQPAVVLGSLQRNSRKLLHAEGTNVAVRQAAE